MHIDFWSNLTLEKPIRGKLVREGVFIISELREIFYYQQKLQTFLINCAKVPPQNLSHILLEIHAQKTDLYDP
jgi:hypothetical protein